MSVIAQWVSATQDAVILTIGTSIPQNVRVRISESESFDEWRETPTQFIQDPHRVGRFRINDLKPDTTYYYQIYAGGVLDPSRSDQIRTLPVAPRTIRIAFGSEQDEHDKNAVSYQRIAARDVDLFIHLGDMWHGDVQSGEEIEWTSKWRTLHSQQRFASVYRRTPSMYIYDDHDGAGNDFTEGHPYIDALLSSYDRWVPYDDLPLRSVQCTYQRRRLGHVEVFFMDTRARQAQGTQLGPEQRAMLLADLKASTAAVKVLGSGAIWVGPDSDGWSGRGGASERKMICDWIAEEGITGVVILEGGTNSACYDDGTTADYSDTGTPTPLAVFRGSPLDMGTISTKGGPYSGGPQVNPNGSNYGILEISEPVDGVVTVTGTLRDATDESTIYEYGFDVPAQPTGVPASNPIFSPAPSEPLVFTPAGATDGPEAPSAAPTVTLTPASQTALSLSLSEVDAATGYRYRVGTSGSWTDLGNNRTTQITGLSPGTSYTVQARAYNAAGDGPIGSATTSTLEPEVNAPPVFQTSPPTSVRAGQVYVYNGVVTDADGDPITVTLEEGPDWLELTDHGDGTFTLEGIATNE